MTAQLNGRVYNAPDTEFVAVESLQKGDVIVERHKGGTRKYEVFSGGPSIGCTGIHVNIRSGGSWCYARGTEVEIKNA